MSSPWATWGQPGALPGALGPPRPDSRRTARDEPRAWMIGVVVLLVLACGAATAWGIASGTEDGEERSVAGARAGSSPVLEDGWRMAEAPFGDYRAALPAATKTAPGLLAPTWSGGDVPVRSRIATGAYHGTSPGILELDVRGRGDVPSSSEAFATQLRANGAGFAFVAPVDYPLGPAARYATSVGSQVVRGFALHDGEVILLLQVSGPEGSEATCDHALLVMIGSLQRIDDAG